jgi:hypothetical protein
MVMSVVRELNEGHAWTVTEGTYITYLYVLEFEPRSKIFGVTISSRKAFCFSTKRRVTGKHGNTPHCQAGCLEHPERPQLTYQEFEYPKPLFTLIR